MKDNSQFSVSLREANDDVKIDADSLASSLCKLMPKNFSLSKKCCIFKIPNILSRHNPKAYLPNAFSIGPWHHDGGEHLKPAEEIKLNYLRCLLSRWPSPETKLKEFIQAIGEIEEDVRANYAGSIEMSVDDFVKLLVIDGCFIIEVFRKNYENPSCDEYDPIFHMPCMIQYLFHDLILLENQIPWSVLELLFNMTMTSGSPSLEHLGIKFFENIFSSTVPPLLNSYQGKNHILDLLREWLVSLSDNAKEGSIEEGDADEGDIEEGKSHILNLLWEWLVSLFNNVEEGDVEEGDVEEGDAEEGDAEEGNGAEEGGAFLGDAFLGDAVDAFLGDTKEGKLRPKLMPSAQSLNEAGIKFKKRKSTSVLDVKFVNGVLEVPSLLIHEITEDIFRNLISFEQCYSGCPTRITSYAVLLDSLINTEKDLKALCETGIIDNWLNPDDATQCFNKLYHDAYLKEYYYLGICEEVNKYCHRRWPRWRAAYIHSYFGTPWAIASQVIAAVLLLEGFLETAYYITEWIN